MRLAPPSAAGARGGAPRVSIRAAPASTALLSDAHTRGRTGDHIRNEAGNRADTLVVDAFADEFLQRGVVVPLKRPQELLNRSILLSQYRIPWFDYTPDDVERDLAALCEAERRNA